MKNAARIGIIVLIAGAVAFGYGVGSKNGMNMSLKIIGIEGECTNAGHVNEIEVLAWSWGMSAAQTFRTRIDSTLQDISLTKFIDRASPVLIQHCAQGAYINKVIFFVTRKEGANDIIRITLENAFISSVSTGGSGGEDRLTENISIGFAKATYEYRPITKNAKDEWITATVIK